MITKHIPKIKEICWLDHGNRYIIYDDTGCKYLSIDHLSHLDLTTLFKFIQKAPKDIHYDSTYYLVLNEMNKRKCT